MQFTSSTKTMLILTLVLTISLAFQNTAFAEVGMTLTATATKGSSMVTVSGETRGTSDITLVVNAPNGNKVYFNQIKPDANGHFETTLNTSGFLWNQDGAYLITAQQGQSSIQKLKVEVEITGGKVQTAKATASSMTDLMEWLPKQAERGLTIDAEIIEGSTEIGISGHTSSLSNDITVVVTAPNGNKITVDQIRPDIDGNFKFTIEIGSDLWKQDGFYTVTVQQEGSAEFKKSVDIEVKAGKVVPEFGAVAALILAVAIISIIAVSARSRLSLIPKY